MKQIALELEEGQSLQRAICDALRAAMLDGRFGPGARLPSTRDLASQLGTARGTVVLAYEQLTSEGYLTGARGAGTFVADVLPDSWFTPKRTKIPRTAPERQKVTLSARGAKLARAWHPVPSPQFMAPRPFRPHTPSIESFPYARWSRLVARHARKTNAVQGHDIDSRGYRPLREALAEHLRSSRGVRCDADRILIVPGIHQALDLAARLLLDVGDPVWLENPGYFGARSVLEASGAKLVPVPVDGEGLVVEAGIAAAPRARLAYVTPAHQVPLGVLLSLGRRMRLLQWAASARAWIFEDDYDSEFRYEDRPLPALQGLDDRGVVLHAGTFGKLLFPGLRVSYLVLPDALVDPFARAMTTVHRYVPCLAQAALTDFIVEGDLGRHVRRMRGLYGERRAALLEGLETELGDRVEVISGKAGFDVLALLDRGLDDRLVSKNSLAAGIETLPLSMYTLGPCSRGGLLLGFAAVSAARTRRAVGVLREVCHAVLDEGRSRK